MVALSTPAERRTLDAATFIALLQGVEVPAVEDCRILGAVILIGALVKKPVRVSWVTFEGEVDFTDTTFDGGVDFSGCTFEETLALKNVRIDGDLTLDDVRVHNQPSTWDRRLVDARACDLSGAEITGTLSMNRSVITGSLIATAMNVGAELSITGTEIDGEIDITSCEIGALTLGAWRSAGTRPVVVQGYFNDNVQANNLRVRGPVALVGIQARRNVVLVGGNFENSIYVEPLLMTVEQKDEGGNTRYVTEIGASSAIQGDLNLATARVKGFVQLQSASIGGELTGFSITCGTFNVRPLVRGKELIGAPCSFGRLNLAGANVANDVILMMLRVTGGPDLEGVQGVTIPDATIGGNLRFWGERAYSSSNDPDPPANPDPLATGAVVNGEIDINRTTVRGNCEMTNLWTSAAIRLEHATVRGNITFRSRESLVGSRIVYSEIRERLRKLNTVFLRARAVSLDLRRVRCEGAIDLSGLDLTKDGESSDLPPGSIVAQSAYAAGEIRLCARNDTDHDETGDVTIISGDVDFAADFAKVETARFVASHDRLRLTGAKIGELCLIARRTPEISYPSPIDLGDVSVQVWNIGGERGEATRFRALLKSARAYRRDTYVSIEKNLRNAGHDGAAIRIYKDMRNEEWRQKRHDARRAGLFSQFLLLARWPFQLAFRHLMGYGTAPGRLLFVIALVWAAMLPAWYMPTNFEESELSRIARGYTSEPQPPPANEWRGATPFFTSIRYHVPIVGLVAHDDWELTEKGHLRCAAPNGVHQSTVPWSPQDWGVMISLLNWALWPFVLTFTIRKLLRY